MRRGFHTTRNPIATRAYLPSMSLLDPSPLPTLPYYHTLFRANPDSYCPHRVRAHSEPNSVFSNSCMDCYPSRTEFPAGNLRAPVHLSHVSHENDIQQQPTATSTITYSTSRTMQAAHLHSQAHHMRQSPCKPAYCRSNLKSRNLRHTSPMHIGTSDHFSTPW